MNTSKLKNNKRALSALTWILLVIIIIGAVVGSVVIYWYSTHYNIDVGTVGIVTDQVGKIIRVDVGPTWYAEKNFWESVKYFDIKVRTIDMLSPSTTTVNGTTTMSSEPLSGLKYGAILASTSDGNNVFMDISVQWHYDVTSPNWKDKIIALYTDYGGSDPAEITIVQGFRNAIYTYARNFTIYQLAYTIRFSDTVTTYVSSSISSLTTLHDSVVVDKVFIRRTVPPLAVQLANLQVVEAQQRAKAILTIANATRDATIQVAQGQSTAIKLVVNATNEAVQRLMTQNATAEQALNYLGLQYVFDQLRQIAKDNPSWNISLFINAPSVTFTKPISP